MRNRFKMVCPRSTVISPLRFVLLCSDATEVCREWPADD